MGERDREREGGRCGDGDRERFCLFGWLVGFSTSSSTTRLYRGRVPRQFYVLPRGRKGKAEKDRGRWSDRDRQIEREREREHEIDKENEKV